MSDECKRCHEHCLECNCKSSPNNTLCTLMIERLVLLGRVEEKLSSILDDEIFNMLSKHDPFWESEHQQESEKLYDLRCKLSFISDNLGELWTIVKGNEE